MEEVTHDKPRSEPDLVKEGPYRIQYYLKFEELLFLRVPKTTTNQT